MHQSSFLPRVYLTPVVANEEVCQEFVKQHAEKRELPPYSLQSPGSRHNSEAGRKKKITASKNNNFSTQSARKVFQ